MRVFTILLMIAVTVGGGLGGYRLITGRDLVSPADFGFAASTSASVPLAQPLITPTPPPPGPTPKPTQPPAATATPVPDNPQTMVVGNTDGLGVYVRKTPRLDDKLKAWREGTRMEIIGESVQSEGRKWRKVRSPDGADGYVPEEFLVEP